MQLQNKHLEFILFSPDLLYVFLLHQGQILSSCKLTYLWVQEICKSLKQWGYAAALFLYICCVFPDVFHSLTENGEEMLSIPLTSN